MTVKELRDALRGAQPSDQVWITFATEDERKASCVTLARDGVRICDNRKDMTERERILHVDPGTAL